MTDASRSAHRQRSQLKFFLLVFALSALFWLIGAAIDVPLMPGLPVSALVAFSPMLAALVLVHEERKAAGVAALLRGSFDFKRIGRKRWYLPIVPLLQARRPAVWIAWWCLYAMAARVLTVWLYNNAGKSVFAAALFHTMLNLSWMLFPIYGSHFDVRLASLVMGVVAAMVAVVWGPTTLTRLKHA